MKDIIIIMAAMAWGIIIGVYYSHKIINYRIDFKNIKLEDCQKEWDNLTSVIKANTHLSVNKIKFVCNFYTSEDK